LPRLPLETELVGNDQVIVRNFIYIAVYSLSAKVKRSFVFLPFREIKDRDCKKRFFKNPNRRTISGRFNGFYLSERNGVKKIVQKVKVKNALGLHARPAAMIAKLLQGSKSQVSISYRHETVNARSIMSILMLAIKKNSQITLIVEGEDAEETLEKLAAAFENQFGEMDS
jgi:phosphocarrier protein HPr